VVIGESSFGKEVIRRVRIIMDYSYVNPIIVTPDLPL
jgi:hypothetical protein